MQFFTVFIIAFVSVILYNIYNAPKDDPIFRNLANSTTILVKDLVKFKLPASSNIIELRTTSNFLSEIIPGSPFTSYLRSIGEKAYIAGEQIEKVYNTGSFVLDELSKELQGIRQNLSQPSEDSLMTEKNAQHFLARSNQVLTVMKNFHSRLADIERTIREIQLLYHGHGGDSSEFLNVVNYFNENESTLKLIYDMKIVQKELESEQKRLNNLMVVDREVMRVGQSIDFFRLNVTSFQDRIKYLSNRKKIVTLEDRQVLDEVVITVKRTKEIWDMMDAVDGNPTLRIDESQKLMIDNVPNFTPNDDDNT